MLDALITAFETIEDPRCGWKVEHRLLDILVIAVCAFLGWVRAVFRPDEDAPRQLAIDGKTVRRSFDRKHGRSPLHLVSAYATEDGIVLAQRAAEGKGGELAVLPDP